MALNYERIGWENAPSTNTPIDAGSLNHMDNGILAVSNLYDVDVPYLKEQVAGIPAMLDSYLADQIGIDVGKWLDDHVTPGGSTIVVDDTLTISGAAADSKTVGDALAAKPSQSDVEALEEELNAGISELENALSTKADQDGAYPDLTAGQVLSKVESADSVPYNFRAVGKDATLEYTDAIVGGSVVWNQLWYVESRSYTVTAGAQQNVFKGQFDRHFISGHKYCAIYSQNATLTSILRNTLIFDDGSVHYQSTEENHNLSAGVYAWVFSATASSNYGNIWIWSHTPNVDVTYSDPILIDLTKMFGTTIADYIYTLETATAGSGVAWLRKHFPKLFTYQPYNAGEIVSVQGLSQHVTVGFNQWNEEWEVGSINDNGQNSDWNAVWRSKNYIPVISGGAYYLKATTLARIFYYDAQKNFISYDANPGNEIIVMPDNCCFVRIRSNAPYNAYNHDICINLSDPSRNGEYEPYQKRTYPLDDSLTLRGILKLDSNNQLYADGDRYLPDGTVQRRYGVVDLGTLNWTKSGNPQRFEGSAIPNAKAPATTYTIPDIMTDIYMPTYSSDGSSDRVIILNINGEPRIYDSAKYQSMSASEFKTAMNGVMCVYELTTPTTETADPYTVPQIVDPDGTEEYVSTSIVPVGHESRYPLDIAGRLDKILTMPTANGTYTLRATVNNGAVTYAWVST